MEKPPEGPAELPQDDEVEESTCSSCGATVAEDDEICSNCGADL